MINTNKKSMNKKYQITNNSPHESSLEELSIHEYRNVKLLSSRAKPLPPSRLYSVRHNLKFDDKHPFMKVMNDVERARATLENMCRCTP